MAQHARFEKLVAEAKKNITEISSEDAAVKFKSGEALIVDVREKDEWDEEHVPGAIHMSRGTIELDIEEKSSRHKRINHLSLRWWRSVCGRSGKSAKNGLQQRPLHGRRFQSLESRRIADDEVAVIR